MMQNALNTGTQLEEALQKLGAKEASECCTVLDAGDVVKKTDANEISSRDPRLT